MIRNKREPPAPPGPEAEPERVQRWSVPECPFAISYTNEILERIRRRSEEALHGSPERLPQGGLEMGGVLFGRVHPNARAPARIEITGERTIECSHGAGAGFILSDEEAARIPEVFERARVDPELSAFSVIGLWIWHVRAGLVLTEPDVVLFQRYFRHAWQIVLVLKPESGGTRGTFFFREGGKEQPHRTEHEFLISGSAATGGEMAPETSEPDTVAWLPRRFRLWTRIVATVVAMIAAALAGAALTHFWRIYGP